MRVKEFHIKNFRSILDSGVISADYYLNTFIGANESGKTSVLKALNNLSFTHDEDDICTFSESWENWQSNEINKEDIDLIDITFELDENDKKSFSKLHKELVTDTIKVNNCFEGLFQIEIDGINLDEISSKIFEERISKKINHIHKELNKLLKFFRNNDESFRNVENAITQIILVLEEYPNNVEDILERNFF
ncbi:MAG: AAA family ATPase [Methanobacterium sp. ERen5]|nr:MAG: AAA family ATPase [Methanobacterium sp. ERen5]